MECIGVCFWVLRLCLCYVPLLFILVFKGYGQDSVLHQVQLEADIRERFEAWYGMNMLNYGNGNPSGIGRLNDKFLFQRIVLGVTYEPAERFQFVMRIQDSRAPGWSLRNALEPQAFRIPASGSDAYYIMNPGEEFFELREGFLRFRLQDSIVTFEARAGRQKIFFGDDRIFGPADWGNTGRWTWDAIRLDLTGLKWKTSVFAGGTKVNDPNRFSVPFTHLEFTGGGVYAEYSFTRNIKIEPFYALKLPGTAEYVRTLNFKKHWTGFRIFGTNGRHVLVDATVVYMSGTNAGRRIDASAHAMKAGYQRTIQSYELGAFLRHTMASGSATNSPVVRTFESPYGGIEKFLGRMNIFQWSNVEDRELMLELKHKKGFRIESSLHLFYFPHRKSARLLNSLKSDRKGSFAGYEIDVFMQHSITTNLQLTVVSGMFVPQHLVLLNGTRPEPSFMFAMQLHYKFKYCLNATGRQSKR